MVNDAFRANLTAAIAHWGSRDYYEAHEVLEDVAEAFEDDTQDFAIAMALVRVAASLHKTIAAVGVRAVPGKLDGALRALADAPDVWYGVALAGTIAGVRSFRAQLEGVQNGAPVPPGLIYPGLERAPNDGSEPPPG